MNLWTSLELPKAFQELLKASQDRLVELPKADHTGIRTFNNMTVRACFHFFGTLDGPLGLFLTS
jgi:hypothetical protein